LRYVVDNQVVERIDRNVAILLGSWATTFLKRMTLVIGSVYTLYNHVQDVRPYQSPRHPDSHGRKPTHRKIVKNTGLAECF
jgi:hypothetical protein